MEIVVKSIGVVHGPRSEAIDDHWGDVISTIHLDAEQFKPESIQGLEQFSHIEVLYHFHKADPGKLVIKAEHPRENPAWPKVGIFAQRKKNRPNRMGVSICKLLSVDGLTLKVQALDAIDGTPVIDIKPCIKEFIPDPDQLRQPNWCSELMIDYFKGE